MTVQLVMAMVIARAHTCDIREPQPSRHIGSGGVMQTCAAGAVDCPVCWLLACQINLRVALGTCTQV